MKNKQSGHITRSSRNRIILYSVIITVIYFACFAFLSTRSFQDWQLWPFFESMIGVFMGAGAIAIITGIILVVQSVIESERDKKQKVFDKKLTLYSGIIEQMEGFYRLKEDEDVPMIDQRERTDLFFTQLKVALLARPKTFRSFSQLINDLADDEGVIKEEATRLLLEFVLDARNDLDVQEEMTPEDQKSLNESMEIAEKTASNIQKTGRGTYFVSEDPFQQYVDQFLSAQGREELGKPKRLWDKRPAEAAVQTIRNVHQYLRDNYENREGVTFDYSRTGGCAGFALGMKRNAKFCYLRFEGWRGVNNDQEETEIPNLYLLKSPKNGYEVPRIDGVLATQSPHGYEFYCMKLSRPEQFTSEVQSLIEDSFQARNDGLVIKERKTKAELIELANRDWAAYRQRVN
jgi:hypothetical protein